MVRTEANKAMNASALPVSAVTKSPDAIGCAPVFIFLLSLFLFPVTSSVGVETPCVVFYPSCKCQF